MGSKFLFFHEAFWIHPPEFQMLSEFWMLLQTGLNSQQWSINEQIQENCHKAY
uniref:Uncharacterized protein LOC105647182 isoform X1 n=1 Tax=Rhizophora mucronata TaxID=61149 RepID=A0A2P2MFF6_RHIMU